jgi:hypothetical protein
VYYSSFRIRNFKGIKDTTINLSDQTKMGVFAIVGLNESGKTTILEAIHSFSPDGDTEELVGKGEGFVIPFSNRVPRHLISNFTGSVSVEATVKINDKERELAIKTMKEENGILINPETIPYEIVFERKQKFENGDFIQNYFSLKNDIDIKNLRQKKWRKPNIKERVALRGVFYRHTPDIAYFPTFVFDFPKRIFLTDGREDKISDFYRQVFQDILDFDGKNLTIENSIIRRVRSDEKKISWVNFLNIWNSSDDKGKIQHVMDRASSIVTDLVFGRWNKIFGEDVKGKEINISFETLQGEEHDGKGIKGH